MNIDSNDVVVEDTDFDDLDKFSDAFFNKGPVEEKKDVPQDDAPAPDEVDEPKENEDEVEDEDQEVDNPDEDKSKFKVGKQKLTARERIEQLNARMREEERARQEEAEKRQKAEARIRELEARQADKTEKVEVPSNGPTIDDKDENGEDKYPLGEYDPGYIRDLLKYERDEARKEIAEEFQRQQEQALKNEAISTLQAEWTGKVEAAEERLPDLRDRGLQLEQALVGTDPQVIESLAMTIMSLENGPDVLYYLSEHVDEARAIAKGGPNALIALGRLDSLARQPKTEVKLVSNAPEPPPSRTRGTGGRFSVQADTDDLDAFSEMFFKKK